MCDPSPHLFTVCTGFDMCCVYKDVICINQFEFHTVFQYFREDLIKEVCAFKATGVVLSESRKVRNRIHHIQSKKPAVCDIYLDLFDRLPHTFDPIEVLDEGDLNKHNRIHAGASVIRAVFIFYKVIDKVPVDRFINQSQHMVLWHHVIHTKQLHLLPLFICIFRHHKKTPPF